MSALRVLFIGGSGIISSACAKLAVQRGIDLYALNRGRSRLRPVPEEVSVLSGDVRDPAAVDEALGEREFDVVVDWVAFTPDQVEADLRALPGPGGPVRLHQLGIRVPDPARPASGHRVDTAAKPVLAVLPRQDRLRGQADPGLPGGGIPGDDRAALAHLRQDRSAVPRRLDRRGPDAAGQAGRRPRRRHVPVDPDAPAMTSPRDSCRCWAVPGSLGEAFHITSDDVLTWNQITRDPGERCRCGA